MADNFYYGGQAVIEGVMVRGRKAVVTAVRRPNGEITTHAEPLNPLYTGLLRKIPFIRGIVVLIEAMVLGIKTLLLSANVSLEQEDTEISGGTVWVLLIFSFALATLLFFIIPLFLTRFLDTYVQLSVFFFHLVEGFIRIAIFALYLRLMTLMPDIRRIFGYHGAEHKTINAYENGASLDVESIKKYGTAHVRCGTSFLFVVMAVAILAFSLVGRRAFYLMVLSRAVLIPVIAAASYEVTYFAGRHAHNPVVRTVLYPGLFFQRLTAKEPDDSQLEVSMAALKRAIEIDRSGEIKPSETLSPGTSL